MAGKAIGAKILKQQLAKQAAKDKEKANKTAKAAGQAVLNQGEYLDRGKQRFDVTKAIANLDSNTFAKVVQEEDRNPRFTNAYSMLRSRKEKFMLTMNDDFIDKVESETESEDEVKANIHEMMYKSNVQTQSLHAHDHSSIALDESI